MFSIVLRVAVLATLTAVPALAQTGSRAASVADAAAASGASAADAARLSDAVAASLGKSPFVDEVRLTPSDGGVFQNNFGISVSLSGDRALIGASQINPGGMDTGAAYVFERSGDAWVETAILVASDGQGSDGFGGAVSLSGDRALVGASRHNAGENRSGAAYVFDLSDGVWTETAKLTALAPGDRDYLGISVALAGDRALVGVPGADLGTRNEGAVYVFERSGGAWAQTATLSASDPRLSSNFGRTVVLDVDRALVGQPYDGSSNDGPGAAYFFERTGGVWVETAKLVPSDSQPIDGFGRSLALSGERAVIGSTFRTPGSFVGVATVFERTGGTWSETARLTASDAAQFDYFGISLALSGDRLFAGAFAIGAQKFGSVYVLDLVGGAWQETEQIAPTDAQTQDGFGAPVAFSGGRLLVGAPGSGPDGTGPGAAYVFTALPPVTGEGAPTAVAIGPVSPNPSADGATVTVTGTREVSVEVFDVLGRRVLSLGSVPSGRIALPTARLAPGAYVVRVAQGAAVVARRFTVAR